MVRLYGIVSAACVAVIAFSIPAAADYGVLNLDNSTIDKVIDGSQTVLLRFDREFPYGEANDAFKAVALRAASARNVIVATVGIMTYGDKMNQDVAERFGFKNAGVELDYKDLDDNFPKFVLFPKGVAATDASKAIRFEKTVSTDNLLTFLRKDGGVRIGLPGTLTQLTEHVEAFMSAAKAGDKKKMMQHAQAAKDAVAADATLGTGPLADTAAYYAKVFDKVTEVGVEYVPKEISRIEKLSGNAMSAVKKQQFTLRRNVLASFL
eukprot:TRINITY_DN34717_c0_g1_i1.p1 TRINITY_DN34717_c0_g1~~TRINITY_DN34717_c0_g1_i1.p1  ORF type:complete len:265 (-),score=67.96 TRINITY_DN34717_c0_g1_i1:217-1011(-)